MTAGPAPFLDVDGLEVELQFRDGRRVKAIDGISFCVGEGEALALVGESGSGKSLIAMGAVDLLPAGAVAVGGRTTFLGQVLQDLEEADWRRLVGLGIGVLFQDAIGAWDPVEMIGPQSGEVLEAHEALGAEEVRRRVLEALGRAIRNRRPDMVLSHHTCPGARWACQRHGVPFSGAVLTPLLWPSYKDPCVFMSWEPQDPPEWYRKCRNLAARWMLRRVVDGRFNRVRRDYGLPRGRDLFYAEALAGLVNLGLWSRHFRDSMPDDPPNGRICGFPWYDRHKDLEHPVDDLERFLDDGDRPIVFTLGTAAVHTAGDFYACAAEACAALARRGLLLTRHSEYAPSNLPRGVRAFTYAPFSTVLPRGCATVHHGGVGTTAQAMRAGRPTVIVPFSHDQFDNAARAKRLGVSSTLKRTRITPRSLVEALRTVLDDPGVAARAQALGQALSQEDGALTAATTLEEIVSR